MSSVSSYETKGGKRWRVQYRDPSGRVRTKRGFIRKSDAQTWADKNAVQIAGGEWIAPEQQAHTVSELYDGWITSQHHLAESSLTSLKTSWRVHVEPRWGATTVGRVKAVDVQKWVDQLAQKRSPSVVHRAYGILRGVMGDAVRFRAVHVNPCEGVRLPARAPKKQYVLTQAQLDALVEETKRFGSLVAFMGYTGARWGEAVALTVGDVDLVRGRATINKSASTHGGKVVVGETKTRQSRVIAVPPHVCSMMREDVRGKLPTALVWTNRAGGYVTTPSRRSWFHSAVDACADADEMFPKQLTPHDLRHAAASMLIARGLPVTVVSRQLGHKSVKLTLDTYGHMYEEQLDDVFGENVVKMQSRAGF